MSKPKYQIEDFLANVSEDNCNFVISVRDYMLENNFKQKIQVTKTTGLQLSFAEPKVKSITGVVVILFLRDGELRVRVYGTNHKVYPTRLDSLPENIVQQIDKSPNCVKFTNPQKCWTGCGGYDFSIRDKRYQKCLVSCFEIKLDAESESFLLELIKSEAMARN